LTNGYSKKGTPMNKIKLFLDFDGTIVDSIKAFCSVYDELYKNEPNFIPSDYTKVNKYNFKDQCPLIETAKDIFQNKKFFEVLEFINENTYNIIKEVNEIYDIYLCTIGSTENLFLKCEWVKEKLPFINKFVLIDNGNNTMDKSIVNMKHGIIIDDHSENLKRSNASIKICLGNIYEWNEKWKGLRFTNWSELHEFLIKQ
jgi:5'(3')-deoxyribonucleotidase